MEEEKAAAYYDELSRKGEGARRFKQGLGFSSSDPQSTSFPSKPPSTSSSFLSGFVRAGATPAPAQPTKQPPPPPHEPSRTGRHSRSPSPSRRHRTRSRSPSRSRRHRSRSRERRRRSRSREREREDRRASRRRSRSRSRSRSPSRRSGRSSYSEDRHGDRRRDDGGGRRGSSKGRGGREGGKVDYSRLIEGYDRMVSCVISFLLPCDHTILLLGFWCLGVMVCRFSFRPQRREWRQRWSFSFQRQVLARSLYMFLCFQYVLLSDSSHLKVSNVVTSTMHKFGDATSCFPDSVTWLHWLDQLIAYIADSSRQQGVQCLSFFLCISVYMYNYVILYATALCSKSTLKCMRNLVLWFNLDDSYFPSKMLTYAIFIVCLCFFSNILHCVHYQLLTASKDSTLGNATVGWERFEFNKDAPLDEDDNDVEGQSW